MELASLDADLLVPNTKERLTFALHLVTVIIREENPKAR